MLLSTVEGKKLMRALDILFLLLIALGAAACSSQRTNLSVHGVYVGMSRNEVEQLHGSAIRGNESRTYAVFRTKSAAPIEISYSQDNEVQHIRNALSNLEAEPILGVSGQEVLLKHGQSRGVVERILGPPSSSKDGWDSYSSIQSFGFEVQFEDEAVVKVCGRQLEKGGNIVVKPLATDEEAVALLGPGRDVENLRVYDSLGCMYSKNENVELITIYASTDN